MLKKLFVNRKKKKDEKKKNCSDIISNGDLVTRNLFRGIRFPEISRNLSCNNLEINNIGELSLILKLDSFKYY